MKLYKHTIDLESRTQLEFIDITEKIQEIVEQSGVRDGQATVYVTHTTMGVGINHNEPMLLQDFMRILYKIVPVDDHYSHDLFELRRDATSDGRSNGHSHCKSLLMGSSETVLIEHGRLILGKRQSIFAIEFDGARKRDVIVQVMGM